MFDLEGISSIEPVSSILSKTEEEEMRQKQDPGAWRMWNQEQ